jgi:hypothetical protein
MSEIGDSADAPTSSHGAALATCLKLGIDPTQPMDLNSRLRGPPSPSKAAQWKEQVDLSELSVSTEEEDGIRRRRPRAGPSPRAASTLQLKRSVSGLSTVTESPGSSRGSPGSAQRTPDRALKQSGSIAVQPNIGLLEQLVPKGKLLVNGFESERLSTVDIQVDVTSPPFSQGEVDLETSQPVLNSSLPRGLRGKKRAARFFPGLDNAPTMQSGTHSQSSEVSNMEILPVPNLPRLNMPRSTPATGAVLKRSASSPHIMLRAAKGERANAKDKLRRLNRRLSITALMKPKVQWKSLIRLIDHRPLKKPSLARHLSFAHIPSLHLRSDPITILARKATRVRLQGGEEVNLSRGPSKAFFLLKDQHPLRITIHQLILHSRFTRSVTLLVVFSTLILMGDRPALRRGSREWKGLLVTDAVLAALFVTEVLLKMTAVSRIGATKSRLEAEIEEALDMFLFIECRILSKYKGNLQSSISGGPLVSSS